MLDASWPLLRAAQKSGEIRTDLTLEQILDMIAAIAKIPGDTSYRRADPASGTRRAPADQEPLIKTTR